MIFVRLEGHNFEYEVKEVLRLFYNEQEIVFLENEPPEEPRGIFLLCHVAEEARSYSILLRLKDDGVIACENTFHLDAAGLSEEGLNSQNYDDRELTKLKRELKKEIKRQIYLMLEQFTGEGLPWGVLTGIRPAKIVHEMEAQGLYKDAILSKLKNFYRVSDKKSRLLLEVAQNEKTILKSTLPQSVGIYIGIPFCPSRCLYCSFTSNPIGKYKTMVDKYLEALKLEIRATRDILKENSLDIQSLYIGGGTPTSISAQQLQQLLEYIESFLDISNIKEYTLEAGRPDSIDRDKLQAILLSRVDRISINPQTMNDDTLKLIGRNHTARDILDAYGLARSMGFKNINMDIIAGLPGENVEMFENTLKEIQSLAPESLTVHTMSIKRASRLNENREDYTLLTQDETAQMIDLSQEYVEAMEMHPYYLYRQKNIMGNLENVGYCLPGFESIYNVQIMEEKQTIIALGAGGITKAVFPGENRIERAFNVKSVEDYVSRIDEMIERKRELLDKRMKNN